MYFISKYSILHICSVSFTDPVSWILYLVSWYSASMFCIINRSFILYSVSGILIFCLYVLYHLQILYPVFCIWYPDILPHGSVSFILYPVFCILYLVSWYSASMFCILYRSFILYSVSGILIFCLYVLFPFSCILCTVSCIFYPESVSYIMYHVSCSLYSAFCILYSVSCILYPVSCILYLSSLE